MSITLFCLVQGAPTAFSVDIDRSLTVDHLKDAIKAKNTNDFANIDAVKLRLWKVEIPDDRDDLIQGQALQDNNQLLPTRRLVRYWTDTPPSEHIHVIIKLPEPVAPSLALATETNSLLERKLDEFEDKLLKRMDVAPSLALATETNSHLKRKLDEFEDKLLKTMDALRNETKASISISRVTQAQYDSILSELNLERKLMRIEVSPKEDVVPFVWGDKKEDAQSAEYMKWLKANVTIPTTATLHKMSNNNNSTLLSSTSVSTQYKLNGTLDMAIVDNGYAQTGYILGGLLVGIEVKKTVKTKDDMQTVLELLLANVVSQYPVIMLLTDLGSNWRYFWLEKGTIAYNAFELNHGVALLGLIASELTALQSGEPATSAITSSDSPYRNRCRFRAAISPNNDVHVTTTPSYGLEMLLKRPKIDPMMFLPEDDIADMRQVFDVMTPSEVVEWKSRKVLEFFVKTPAFQSSVVGNDWERMYA